VKEKRILQLLTIIGLSGWALLFRKGPMKEWFIIYLFKTLISTLIDGPVAKQKYVQYPKRYFPKLYDSNITFVYLLFPLACVFYNQFTYKMDKIKTILSVFLFSVPMTVVENWLEKNTRLVKYGKGWNGFYTLSFLTITFWIVRVFIEWIRILEVKRSN
jgi:hypothetical protein